MERISIESSDWRALVDRLGGSSALAVSARRHGAFSRPRGVRDAVGVLRLCLMYGPGGLSLRALAATAAQLGIADVSDVAILNRIRGAADWLEALCGQRLAHNRRVANPPDADKPEAEATVARGAGRSIRIIDSSLIDAPGGVKWRLHASYDPLAERLTAAAFTSARQGERLDQLPLDSGDIAVADRGFPQPDGLRNTAARHADPLVRVTWNSVTLTDNDNRPLDWLMLCRTATTRGGLDMPVRLHKKTRIPGGRKSRVASPFHPVAMRLVCLPHSAGAAAHALDKARAKNRDGSRKSLDPRTIACADHLMLLTTLPTEGFPAAELGALYRLRWQIELAFKRMKSLMHIDRLPARDPRLARAWLHAHLLVALLTEQIVDQDDVVPP